MKRPQAPTVRVLAQVLLVLNAATVLGPLAVALFSAFKTTREIFRAPFVPPASLDLANFVTVWRAGRFDLYLRNSLIVTGGALALILSLAALAGYALGRFRFRLNGLLYLFFLGGLLIPAKLAIIPLFILLRTLNLLDSRLGLCLVYAAAGLPAAVFILTGFFRALPADLDNAARIDGAGELGVFWRVMLPLIRPALAIVTIYSAIPIWNDFFLPLVLIQTPELKTITQGLSVFFGQYQTDWGALFAGLILAALPIILLYLALSEQFIKGLTAGATR
ncbi:MAG: carbohydrate ABC transporter permease [Candidatus Rokuibacteriota bacterium]|nr:MAG: carbohydrate ABC transporter permease [Candidatus Rokubacteria bacterium]